MISTNIWKNLLAVHFLIGILKSFPTTTNKPRGQKVHTQNLEKCENAFEKYLEHNLFKNVSK